MSCVGCLVLILQSSLFPLFLQFSVHMMSDEEAHFGTESPDARDLVASAEPSRKKGKGKGGKTKGVNNAAGIPESVRKRLGYDTPPEENFQKRKNRLQSIQRYWV